MQSLADWDIPYTTHRIKCESYRVSIVKVVRVLLVLQMCAVVGKSGGTSVSIGSNDGVDDVIRHVLN